jgi:two-component sensor histidine kinase
VVRIPLNPPTLIPSITFMPFILLSGWLGGWGPGLLTTALCTFESLYFAEAPAVALGTLAFSGLVTSLLFEHVKRARRADAAMADMRAQLSREMEGHRRLLESVIQNAPTAIALLRGPDFTFEVVNQAYQALAPGERLEGRTVAEVWPDAAPIILPLLNDVRNTGTPYHATGFAVPRRRGPGLELEERYFDFSYVPLIEDGDVRVLAVAIEVTRNKRAEAELRATCAELSAIQANTPVALFVVNDELRVEKVNELAGRFAGRECADIVGQRPGDAFGCLSALANSGGCGSGPSCGQCSIRTAVLDSLASGRTHHDVEAWMSLSLDGHTQRRCLLISTSVLRSDQASKVLVCALDITLRKRTQLALESALGEKTILLQEIHHRVKNNLAVISSLLSMKADAVENPTARLALEESQQRVHSMALIHEHLYGNDRLDRIDFAQYATQLVHRLQAALAPEPDRIAIELALEPIELAIEQAVPCGLILNELLTNTFKYAFRSRTGGRISVSFRESAPGMRELAVEDDGVGFHPGHLDGRNGKSLGLQIVAVLTTQLDGTLEQEPCSGTRTVLRFPKVD